MDYCGVVCGKFCVDDVLFWWGMGGDDGVELGVYWSDVCVVIGVFGVGG